MVESVSAGGATHLPTPTSTMSYFYRRNASTPAVLQCSGCLPTAVSALQYTGGCMTCPNNTYTDTPGSALCVRCGHGGFSAAGSVSASECGVCPAGAVFNAVSQTCGVCPVNTYSAANSTACTNCTAGGYTAGPGSGSCAECPSGMFLSGRTATPVTWAGPVNVDASTAGALTKNGGQQIKGQVSWDSDAGAISTQQILLSSQPQGVTFKCSAGGLVAGLSSTDDPNTHYADIQFGVYCTGPASNPYLHIVESDQVAKPDFGHGWTADDVFDVRVTGTVVEYRQNGVLVYTSTRTPSFPLHVDVSLSNMGISVTDVAVYSGSDASPSCATCSAGRYSQAPATSCELCPVNKYSAASSTACTNCTAGYHSAAGADACPACAAGRAAARSRQGAAPDSTIVWTGTAGVTISAGGRTVAGNGGGWDQGAVSTGKIWRADTEAHRASASRVLIRRAP